MTYDRLKPQKILIIKFGAIGDCILTTPAVRAIREKYKDSFIAYLVGKKASNVFENNPNIDEIIIFNEKHYFPKITNLVRYYLNKELINKIKSLNFDLIIDLESSYKSYYISSLSGVKDRIGFKLSGRRKYLNFLYNYKVNFPKEKINQIDRYLKLISGFPLNIVSDNKKTEIFVSDDSRKYIEGFFANNKIIGDSPELFCLNPATLAVGKQWPKEKYAKLADMLIKEFKSKGIAVGLAETDANVVFTWGPNEFDYVKEIEKMMSIKPIIAPQTNVNQLAALIKRCKLFITNDTAPMHIAKAVDIPVIAFFGPTDPYIWGYPDNNKFIPMQAKDVSCINCDDFYCRKGLCMDKITVEEVMKNVREFIK